MQVLGGDSDPVIDPQHGILKSKTYQIWMALNITSKSRGCPCQTWTELRRKMKQRKTETSIAKTGEFILSDLNMITRS
ncbi:hypothetical protein SLA2020_023290 [Shorea laevis]